jgi:hypothetical protein
MKSICQNDAGYSKGKIRVMRYVRPCFRPQRTTEMVSEKSSLRAGRVEGGTVADSSTERSSSNISSVR